MRQAVKLYKTGSTAAKNLFANFFGKYAALAENTAGYRELRSSRNYFLLTGKINRPMKKECNGWLITIYSPPLSWVSIPHTETDDENKGSFF